MQNYAIDVIARAIIDSGSLDEARRGGRRQTDQIVGDYSGRAPYEMFQNAYDAQVRQGGRGRIRFLLDFHEGANGTLYVANSGNPIGEENFEGLCRAAQSTKEPGDGSVGNKGVGFKSVTGICSSVEVVSSAADADHSGFRFRFEADPGALKSFLTMHAERIRDEIRSFGDKAVHADASISTWATLVRERAHELTLPLPMDSNAAPWAEQFGEDFVTVMRLSLRRGAAANIAETIGEMIEGEAPIHLFLDHLGTAEFAIRRRGRNVDAILQRRETRRRKASGSDAVISEIDLGTSGRYLRASLMVPGRELARAAEKSEMESVAWPDAKAAARVSVAVSLDDDWSGGGKFYTFLPTEKGAPLDGHVDAPFYASQSRKNVDLGVPFNAYLFEQVANAAVSGAKALTKDRPSKAATSVTRLICWESKHEILRKTMGGAKRGSAVRVVPTFGDTWASLAASLIDPQFGDSMPGDVVARLSGKAIVDPASEREFGRLATLAFEMDLEPTAAEIAGWIQKRASEQRADAPEWWSGFYDDVWLRFADPWRGVDEALNGCKILLADDGSLHPVKLRARDAGRLYVNPVRLSSPISVPRSIARRMALLKPEVAEVDRGGVWLDAFLKHGIVREYDVEAVLRELASAMPTTPVKQRRTLLAAAAALHDLAAADVDVAAFGFQVPTRSGRWLPARDALFSKEWPDTNGDVTERVLDALAPRESRFKHLKASLLEAPDESAELPLKAWVAFLRAAGVADSIPPDPRVGAGTIDRRGYGLVPARLIDDVSLDAATAAAWESDDDCYPIDHPRSYFSNRTPLYSWFGATDYRAVPAVVRHDVALALLAGLADWDDETLSVVMRSSTGTYEYAWSTPLAAFLRKVDWLPVEDRSRSSRERDVKVSFVRPCDAWLELDSDREDRRPRPLPAVTSTVAEAIRANGDVLERLKHMGLSTWPPDESDRESHIQLNAYVAKLLDKAPVADPTARERATMYRKTWDAMGSLENDEDFDAASVRTLVTRSGSAFRSRSIEKPRAVVFRDRPSVAEWELLTSSVDSEFAEVGKAAASRVVDYMRREAKIMPILQSDITMSLESSEDALPQGALVGGAWRGLDKLVYLVGREHGVEVTGRSGLGQALYRLRQLNWSVLPGATVTWDGGADLCGSSPVSFYLELGSPPTVIANERPRRSLDVAHLKGLLAQAFDFIGIEGLDRVELSLRRAIDEGIELAAATNTDFSRILEVEVAQVDTWLSERPPEFDHILGVFRPVIEATKGGRGKFQRLERAVNDQAIVDIALLIAEITGFPEADVRQAIDSNLTGEVLCGALGVSLRDYGAACRRLRISPSLQGVPIEEPDAVIEEQATVFSESGPLAETGPDSSASVPTTPSSDDRGIVKPAVQAGGAISRRQHPAHVERANITTGASDVVSGAGSAIEPVLLSIPEIEVLYAAGVPFRSLESISEQSISRASSVASEGEGEPLSTEVRDEVSLLYDDSTEDGEQEDEGRTSGLLEPIDRSEPEAAVIGEIGERFAWVHLRERFGGAPGIVQWVSSNRRVLGDGRPSDDTCGFDFLIKLGDSEIAYEVKATFNDRFEITLGPTECRAGKLHRDGGTYRILRLVFDRSTHACTGIYELPNPYSDHGQRIWASVSTQERFRLRAR